MSPTLEQAVRERRVIVCVGSGGVGKTTVAAALALKAATLGRRVVVCTIDPAKRLANACEVCETRPANPGYSWCTSCYESQRARHSTAAVCAMCHSTPANPGFAWCQSCYMAQLGSGRGGGSSSGGDWFGAGFGFGGFGGFGGGRFGGGGSTHCWQAPFGAMFGGRNCQLEAWRALNSQQGHASSVF